MMWWSGYVGLQFGDAPGQITCWRLVRRVLFEMHGLDLPEYGEISAADLAAVARGMAGEAVRDCWLPVEKPAPFDVVLMRVRSRVAHVGIMVDARQMLHVERASHSCVVPIKHFSVRDRIAGYRRHEALA